MAPPFVLPQEDMRYSLVPATTDARTAVSSGLPVHQRRTLKSTTPSSTSLAIFVARPAPSTQHRRY